MFQQRSGVVTSPRLTPSGQPNQPQINFISQGNQGNRNSPPPTQQQFMHQFQQHSPMAPPNFPSMMPTQFAQDGQPNGGQGGAPQYAQRQTSP